MNWRIMMKKMKVVEGVLMFSLVCGLLLLGGCAELFPTTTKTESVISSPDEVYVSPNFDFTQISGLGIFPIFAGNVDDPKFADSFNGALTSEIQANQSQWKVVSYKETLQIIDQAGLGRGYKNLQADINTFSGTQGFGVMTSETKSFLAALSKKTGANASLMSTYNLSANTVLTYNFFSGKNDIPVTYRVCTIKIILYQENKGIMWTATHTVRSREGKEVAAGDLAKVFASYLGKGTLRQL